MIYCIEIERELEEKYIAHKDFDHSPTREEVLEYIMELDLNYDDDYGRITYYPIKLES